MSSSSHLYKPRPYQEQALKGLRNKRRGILLWARRIGKDYTCFHLMLERALAELGQYYYVFPSYTQARKALWDLRDNHGNRLVDLIPSWALSSTNSVEMKILLTNGSLIQLVGAENPDTLRGTNPKGLVFSEFAMANPEIWSAVAKPILAQNQGWAVFASTPMGRNHFYELYKMAEASDDWFTSKVTAPESGVVPESVIQADRDEGMSEGLIQQEYFCTPEYSQVLTAAGLKKICDITVNDLVLSHSGRWRRVKDTMQRPYDGDLIRIRTYGHPKPLDLTPNHQVRVCDPSSQKYSWVPAGNLQKGQYLCFPKLSPSDGFCDADLAELIARYVSDGSVSNNSVTLTLGDKNVNVLKGLQETWKQKGVNSCLIDKCEDKCSSLYLNSTSLVDFFLEHCTACSKTKKLPLSLLTGHYKNVAKWLIEGDGCATRDGWCFGTTSITLAHQALAVFHSAGYRARLHWRQPYDSEAFGRVLTGSGSWRIDIAEPKKSDKLIKMSKYSQLAKIKSVETIPFNGTVFNLHVEKDESYTIWGRAVHNCDWSAGADGLIYGQQIEKLLLDGRLCPVSVDRSVPVHTAWDLGIGDHTAIVAFQVVQTEIHIVDFYEACGHSIEHYKAKLDQWGYLYGSHFAPHDVEARSLQTGTSLRTQASKLGLNMIALPPVSVEAGIQEVRSMLSRTWVDEKRCKVLFRHLTLYSRHWDSRKKVFSVHPKHDEHSHAADAVRMLALGLPKLGAGNKKSGTDILREAYSAIHPFGI